VIKIVVDHWEGEDCIITFEEEGADTVTNLQGKISKISVGGGNQSTDDIYCFANSTINFDKPREKFTPSFDVIFTDTTFAQMFLGGNAAGAGVEMRSSNTKKRWRIIVWFCPKENHKKSGSVIVPPKSGEIARWIFADCKAISFDRDFSADDVLKGTLSFEFSATDSDGYANFFDEWTSAQSTTSLTVLTATAHKGILTWNTTTPAWTGSYRT